MSLEEIPILAFPPRRDESGGKLALHKLERGVSRGQAAFELRIFHRIQNFAELRPGRMSRRDQVVSGHQRLRTHLLRRNLGPLLPE